MTFYAFFVFFFLSLRIFILFCAIRDTGFIRVMGYFTVSGYCLVFGFLDVVYEYTNDVRCSIIIRFFLKIKLHFRYKNVHSFTINSIFNTLTLSTFSHFTSSHSQLTLNQSQSQKKPKMLLNGSRIWNNG